MKNKTFIFVSFVVGAAILFGFRLNASLPEKIIDFKAVDIYGNNVPLSANNKILLLFFDPSNVYDKMKLFYAAALDSKLKKYGLQIIGIAKGECPDPDNFVQQGSIQFPLVADKEYKIHERFGVTQCCGATLLIDETKKIKFFLPTLMEPDNLRQLLEKETRGKIDYHQDRVKQEVFVINKKVPDILLTVPGTGEDVSFDSMHEDRLVVTFFSSLCGMCKTGKRIRTLIDMEQELTSLAKADGLKFVLVFMGPFNEEDIMEWEKIIPMPFDKYITGYLFSNEEKYISDPAKKNDPLTIILDKRRSVIFIEEVGIGETRFHNALLRFTGGKNE
jgi:peroxiredoxin